MSLVQLLRDFIDNYDPEVGTPMTIVYGFKGIYIMIQQLFLNMFSSIFDDVFSFILDFFNGTWFNFRYFGQQICNSLDTHGSFRFFTEDFFFWLIGLLVCVFCLKLAISFFKMIFHLLPH